MRARLVFLAVMALCLLGCRAERTKSTEPKGSPPIAGDGATATTSGADPAKKNQPMSNGFTTAYTAFRAHAAAALGVRPDAVSVTPKQEVMATLRADDHIGNLWRFTGISGLLMNEMVRGWAHSDGTVVTPEQNLGLLFEAAGVWGGSPALDADAIGTLLTWAMLSHRAQPGASLDMGSDGSGTMKFVTEYTEPPAGGHLGAPEYYEHTIVLGADHQATLTTKRVGGPRY